MAHRYIRLSIKLSSFTTLIVVLSMLASFYLAGGSRIEGQTPWLILFPLASLCSGLLFTLFLDRIITVPIQSLVAYTSTMVDNDFQVPVGTTPADEIGILARAMDELRRNVLAQRRSLQELNEKLDAKVEARTRELEEALANLRATQQELIRVEKLASVGRLAGGIAHEINNPAQIIQTRTGFLLEFANDPQLNDDFREAVEVIHRQVGRIARITHDLLIFSRATPMKREALDVSHLLKWCVTLYRLNAQELNVSIATQIPAGLFVIGDAEGLERVFGNLIRNAFDAMEAEGGSLEISAGSGPESVSIAFADSGSGIAPEVLPRIFDPFFTTKRIGRGTGLGLAISYGILLELGGSIHAENQPSGGTIFTVELRRVSAPTPQFMSDREDKGL